MMGVVDCLYVDFDIIVSTISWPKSTKHIVGYEAENDGFWNWTSKTLNSSKMGEGLGQWSAWMVTFGHFLHAKTRT